MSHKYTALFYHLIFSTSRREELIRPEIELDVWKYMGGIARKNGFKALSIGGVEDHVHLLLSLPSTIAPSVAIKHTKGASSWWISRQFADMQSFSWQEGFGIITVSPQKLRVVDNYIQNQRSHHKKETLDNELNNMERAAEGFAAPFLNRDPEFSEQVPLKTLP